MSDIQIDNLPSMSPVGEQPRLVWLDGMRAIAIGMVVLVHSGQTVRGAPSALEYFWDFGQYGVQLFFVISSITVYITINSTQSLSNWIFRRYIRIAPMYYIAILIYVPFFYIEYRAGIRDVPIFSLASLFSNLTFTHGFYPQGNNSVVPGGWSIAIEFTFYIVCLFTACASRSIGKNVSPEISAKLLAISGISCYFITIISLKNIENNGYYYFSPGIQLPILMTGLWIYSKFGGLINSSNTRPATLAIAALTIFASFYIGVWGEVSYSLAPMIFATGIWLSLIALGRKKEYLSNAAFVYIGRRSYSIYLVHFSIIYAIRFLNKKYDLMHFGDDYISCFISLLVTFSLVMIISTAISNFTYRYIELPFINLGRRRLISNF